MAIFFITDSYRNKEYKVLKDSDLHRYLKKGETIRVLDRIVYTSPLPFEDFLNITSIDPNLQLSTYISFHKFKKAVDSGILVEVSSFN